MTIDSLLLAICGAINAIIALLHVAIIFYGAPAYRYFGAGEKMAVMAEQGSLVPAAVTSGITMVFVIFSVFAFAEAGWLIIPYSFLAVVSIASIYTLRGLIVVPLLARKSGISGFDLYSSLISLAIGLLHFAGLFWPSLS